jgi:predicted O-methyltransferase YrrM
LDEVKIPDDLDQVLDEAWHAANRIPGFLSKDEARFIGMVAASAPARGTILEIGSFKGRSTAMLAKVSQRYGLGRVVAVDPHNFNSAELQGLRTAPDTSTFDEFSANILSAGVADFVDARRQYSTGVSKDWKSPIRFLWIDGDHSHLGAKSDFDGFLPYLVPGGVVAFHDTLHEFSGPIRVFVEQVLRSNHFGAAGFVGSIGWAQFRPDDGSLFQNQRASLERLAAPLIPFLGGGGRQPHGIRKILFKLRRSRVPRLPIQPQQWGHLLRPPSQG